MRATAIFLTWLVLLSCNNNLSTRNIVGIYNRDGFYFKAQLELKTKNEFLEKISHYSDVIAEEISTVSGTYEIIGQSLILRPKNISVKHVIDYGIKEDTTRIFSFNDTLLILPWNKRTYLIGMTQSIDPSKNELLSFLNYINEQALKIPSGVKYFEHEYFTKACENCHELDLKKVLPLEWQDYVLDTILSAKITKIEDYPFDTLDMHERLVTLDAGSKSGFKRGMKLYPNFLTEECPRSVRITEVHDSYSKGISTFCDPKVNVVVSTFIQRE